MLFAVFSPSGSREAILGEEWLRLRDDLGLNWDGDSFCIGGKSLSVFDLYDVVGVSSECIAEMIKIMMISDLIWSPVASRRRHSPLPISQGTAYVIIFHILMLCSSNRHCRQGQPFSSLTCV